MDMLWRLRATVARWWERVRVAFQGVVVVQVGLVWQVLVWTRGVGQMGLMPKTKSNLLLIPTQRGSTYVQNTTLDSPTSPMASFPIPCPDCPRSIHLSTRRTC